MVVISGSPGVRERFNNPLLHHRVKDFRTQYEVFRRLCVAAADLTDANTALRDIDRVLAAVVRYRRPGFIELPRDMVGVVPAGPHRPTPVPPHSNPESLAEALAEAVRRITSARRPVIIADVEIHRFGLQDKLLALAEGAGIPIAATMLGKSVVRETHPLFAGIYEGAMGRQEVTQFVEESDCVLLLGAFMTDINLGIYTANLDPARSIYATSEALRISHHHFDGVELPDFLQGLIDAGLQVPQRPLPPRQPETPFQVCPDAPDDHHPAHPAAQPVVGRVDGGHRRRGRRPVCLQRPGDPPANGVPGPGLLRLDGFCGAGRPGRDDRPARPATGGAGG